MNATKNTKLDIAFQIKGIDILDFELNQPKEKLTPTTALNYNITLKQRMNLEKELVFVDVEINILHQDNITILGIINVSNIFKFDALENILEKKENNINSLPTEIIEIINNISISTTRGVMFTCFRGTFLHNAILPIINQNILKQINSKEK